MASPLQFAFRTQKTIGLTDAWPAYEPVPGFTKPEGNLRCCVYSPCGRFFSWASAEAVTVVDASTGHEVLNLPILNVYELGFSPLGTFLITWERFSKDEAGDAVKNLKVWRTVEEGIDSADKQPLGKFVQKQQGNWNLQYTADEKLCARLVSNEVHFHESHDLVSVWNKLRVEGVTDYALARESQNHSVAVFVPERKGQPAAVKVFSIPNFNAPVTQKTFFKGDKVQMKWNKQGTSLIVLAQTDVDKSGKSYYGETTLYYLSTTGAFDARVTLDKEGPIHDVAWCPNGREFGVVYGYMPAKATIFNHRAVATHSFPLGPRNTISFSPNSRFVLVAGFGNLAGQIDVYDLQKDFRKVCTIEGGNPSVCEWSPDSRFIMTATTSPRLRVDNGVRLWHVSGGVQYNEDMVELYNVLWRPQAPESVDRGDPLSPVPAPHASATAYLGTVKTPSKPAGAYRPPGARGLATPLHFKREDEGGAAHMVSQGTQNVKPGGFTQRRGGVPGAEPVEPAAEDGAGKRNKKKRNKKGANQEGRQDPDMNGGASLAPPGLEHGGGPIGDGRSPERRAGFQGGQNNNNNRNFRSQSRNNAGRSRSNTQYGSRANGHQQHMETGVNGNGNLGVDFPNGDAPGSATSPSKSPLKSPSAGNTPVEAPNPNAKKIRALQKKIRAIEELEMRHAGGEKLEQTQLNKIKTKSVVAQELEGLESQG